MDQHRLAGVQKQLSVDALQCGQPGRRDGASKAVIESFGCRCDTVGRNRRVLGIEPAFRIVPAVGINRVSHAQSADAGPCGNHAARPVGSQHERERRVHRVRPPAVPNICVPATNSRGMQRDQYFVGVRYRDRQHANRQYFRAAEAVDRRGSHRLWNGGHVASHSAARHLRGRPRQLYWRRELPTSFKTHAVYGCYRTLMMAALTTVKIVEGAA
jgi:hypothetical protein